MLENDDAATTMARSYLSPAGVPREFLDRSVRTASCSGVACGVRWSKSRRGGRAVARRLALVALTVAVFVVVPASSQATGPGSNGKIAFSSWGSCLVNCARFSRIFTIDPDGSDLTQVGYPAPDVVHRVAEDRRLGCDQFHWVSNAKFANAVCRMVQPRNRNDDISKSDSCRLILPVIQSAIQRGCSIISGGY
jgi:hypothetical protein